MVYQDPERKTSAVNWTLPIVIIVVFVLALIIGIVIAVNSTKAAPSAAGTQIAKQLEAPVNGASYAAVQSDVRNSVSNIAASLAQNPTEPIASIQLTPSQPQIQLVAAGDATSYTVTGTYTPTGYAFQYSSATGQFSVVSAGSDLRSAGATS